MTGLLRSPRMGDNVSENTEVDNVRVWIDIKNAHEPLFFKSFFKYFENTDFYVTSREFAEISKLLQKFDISYELVGGRPEGNMIKRILGFWVRVLQLYFRIKNVDVSLSHSSVWAVYAASLRRKKSIVFTDNDINFQLNKRLLRYVDFLFTPDAISKELLVQHGARADSLYQFKGFKEDLYIADFSADPNFLDELPFSDFVTVRAESLQAMYVPKDTRTIVPELLRLFEKENINVLFLPRYETDKEYAKGLSNVYMPPAPLKGLDVCYYSRAILTGAGTFSREAACMGTPAVSFFPGERLLAVDQKMVDDGWVFHTRDPKAIVEYVLSSKKREVDLDRSREVQKATFRILGDIFEEIEKKQGK